MSDGESPPVLSVVVAATDAPAAVARTFRSLLAQEPGSPFEVVVAAPVDRVPTPADLPPGVRWVEAPAGTTVPRLRRLGLDQARGAVIALTEDSCELAPGWASGWVACFDDPAVQAATGPVVAGMGHRAVDVAVFLCEYAPFLPVGGAPGPVERLAGNNFALRRELAGRLDPLVIEESEIPGRVGPAASAFGFVSSAVARHVRRYGLRESLHDRLKFGRSYGRGRGAGLGSFRRGLALVLGPAVFAVQVARLGKVLRTRRPCGAGPLLRALPLTAIMLAAWSAGEWLGWVEGAFQPRPSRRRHGTAGRPAGTVPAHPAP